MHCFIKLVNQKTSGVAGSRGSQDGFVSQVCVHICSHSLSSSLPLPISGYFLFTVFHQRGALSIWQYPWPTLLASALFGPTQKEHFPQEVPKLSQRGLGLTQLDLLSRVPLIPFVYALFSVSFSSAITQSVSHSHFQNFFLFKICFNKHAVSARMFSRVLFRLGPSGSGFMGVFSPIDCRGTLLVKAQSNFCPFQYCLLFVRILNKDSEMNCYGKESSQQKVTYIRIVRLYATGTLMIFFCILSSCFKDVLLLKTDYREQKRASWAHFRLQAFLRGPSCLSWIQQKVSRIRDSNIFLIIYSAL